MVVYAITPFPPLLERRNHTNTVCEQRQTMESEGRAWFFKASITDISLFNAVKDGPVTTVSWPKDKSQLEVEKASVVWSLESWIQVPTLG